MKTRRYAIILLFGVVGTLIGSTVGNAKMQAPQSISAKETIAFYKVKKKSDKLTPEEADTLKLAQLAQDVFGITEFYITGFPSSKEEQAKAVNLIAISNSIQNALQQKPSWDQKLSASDLEKVKQTSDLIKQALGEDSYAWAWVNYKKGDKAMAKKILNRGFDRAHAEVLKISELGFRNSNPLQSSEAISKALTPLSSKEENKSREEKMQKMRLHISSLPDMQMMT